MLGSLILATCISAALSLTAALLGTSWWIALLMYAFGGAALTVLFAWTFAQRQDADTTVACDAAAEYAHARSAEKHVPLDGLTNRMPGVPHPQK